MKCRNCKHNGFLTDEDDTQYSWCEVACDNLDVDEERRCAAFVKATNADRIRAMTDEELAEWLDNVCKSAYDEGYTKDSEPLMSPYPSTASEWFTWLKQEASDGKD